MPNVLVQDTSLRGIADAIREKNKSSLTYKPADMAAAISSLPTGGSSLGPLKGNEGKSFFSNVIINNPVLKDYCRKEWLTDSLIDPELGLTDMSYMFSIANYWDEPFFEEIPITIYYHRGAFNAQNIFKNARFTKAPLLRPARSTDASGTADDKMRLFNGAFYMCRYLETIPEDWLDWDEFRNWLAADWHHEVHFTQLCYGCKRLKSVSKNFLDFLDSVPMGNLTHIFEDCYSLNKIENMGYYVWESSGEVGPSYLVDNCISLSKFTFKNNGRTGWGNSFLDFTHCGWASNPASSYEDYGFTEETLVTDAATYQALKNTNYWTTDVKYSKYNHTSMVETINSLPEIIQTYKENTIGFKATQGDSTDEGGASNLTEEELAVASAKGWTVSIS